MLIHMLALFSLGRCLCEYCDNMYVSHLLHVIGFCAADVNKQKSSYDDSITNPAFNVFCSILWEKIFEISEKSFIPSIFFLSFARKCITKLFRRNMLVKRMLSWRYDKNMSEKHILRILYIKSFRRKKKIDCIFFFSIWNMKQEIK